MNQRLARRGLLQVGSLGVAGLVLPQLLRGENVPDIAKHSPSDGLAGFGKAKNCILIFAWGGPSQLDTWDPKPNAPNEIRGAFNPIQTKTPGIEIGENFPRLAECSEDYAIIRSVTHDDPAHLSSVHHLLTGHYAPQVKSDDAPPSRKDSPHIGSVMGRFSSVHSIGNKLPPFVTLPWIVSHPAAPGGMAPGQNAGWLGAGHDPFLVSSDPNAPDFSVSGLGLGGLTRNHWEARRELLQSLDDNQATFSSIQSKALGMLLDEEVRQAFEISKEPDALRDRYGRHIHGQSLLLARRLIESGVRLVCVNWHQDGHNFWDTHGDNFRRLKDDLMPPADAGFSALIGDLKERGLLAETLLVWVGEFGRAPRINNANAGRDHWPNCYSAVMAGGGIRGGQVYGRSDAQAAYPASNPVAPADLTATMYHALGIPQETLLYDSENRPHSLTSGKPILDLFTSSATV